MLLELSPSDVTRIRFALSPWEEAVTAVRAIGRPPSLHRAWAERARERLRADEGAAERWRLLRAFVVPRAFVADALTPPPDREETVEETRARVEAQPLELWEDDVEHLREFADAAATAELDRFEADPAAGVARLTAAVTWVWEAVVEPHWPRIRALEIADVDHRLALLARGGLDEMLRTLHPEVHRVPGGLELDGKNCTRWPGSEGTGLTLIPTVFAWPGTLVLNRPPFATALSYAPRGIGRLWASDARADAASPLDALIGGTRATVLRQLDLPMTTSQLSCGLSLPTASVSDHLRVLARAGALETHRRGREVYYARTPLGELLAER